MSEKKEDEKEINFEKLMEIFSLWTTRLEEKGKDWTKKDWINWSVDITDAIYDIYHYLKSLGILAHGMNELLYKTKEENEDIHKEHDCKDTERLYS